MENNLFLPIVCIDPMIKQAVDIFIDKVFVYYNGRINPNNKIRLLDKAWANKLTMTNGEIDIITGQYKNSIIEIRPFDILITSSYLIPDDAKASINNIDFMNKVYSFILLTIIHELYHADQVSYIDNAVLTTSTTEAQATLQELRYVRDNSNEFKDVFGVILDRSVLNQEYINFNRYEAIAIQEYIPKFTHISTNRDRIFNYLYSIIHSDYDNDVNAVYNMIDSAPNCRIGFIDTTKQPPEIFELDIKSKGIFIDKELFNDILCRYAHLQLYGLNAEVLNNNVTKEDLVLIMLPFIAKPMIDYLTPVNDENQYKFYYKLFSKFM